MRDNYQKITRSCPECGLVLLTAEEAATVMGISYPRVRAILNNHPERLGAFKIGNSWIIPEHAAREYQRLPAHRPSKNRRGR